MRHDLRFDGFGVRLVPLADRHAPALLRLVDDELWRYMGSPVPHTEVDVRTWVAAAHAAEDRWAFAVIGDDGQVRGSTSLYEWDDLVRRVEIGYTFYGPAWHGGSTNPACKYLLLRHAFEDWDARRVALRCDSRNARSAAAIRKLGAASEGVLRHHRLDAGGKSADTAYFSILAAEWPAVSARLLDRLDAAGDRC